MKIITTIGGTKIDVRKLRSHAVWCDNEKAWYDSNPAFNAYVPMIVFGKGIYYSDKPATARELLAMGPRIREVEE